MHNKTICLLLYLCSISIVIAQPTLSVQEPVSGTSVTSPILFGNVYVPSNSEIGIRIGNSGAIGGLLNVTISIVPAAIGPDFSSYYSIALWSSPNANLTLPYTVSYGPGTSDDYVITFTPPATAPVNSNLTAVLKFTTSGAPASQTFNLTGQAMKTTGIVLESEDALLSGAVKKSAYAGFTGTGYADYINNSSDYIQWTANVPTAGQYKLDFRYANGTTKDRPLEIRVNNVVQEASKSFPSTSSWTTWSEVSSTVNLNAGSNTIRATAIGSSGGNIDHLTVSSTATSVAGTPIFSVVLTAPTAGSTIYYTLDGTTPTQSSPVYSSPIAISSATTIKTFSHAAGYTDSPIATFVADVPASSARTAAIGETMIDRDKEEATLYQNNPNPFNTDTEVRMYLPAKVGFAVLYVYDLNGQLAKKIVVSERGETAAHIEAGYLRSGIYAYTLEADGQIAGTRRMILTE